MFVPPVGLVGDFGSTRHQVLHSARSCKGSGLAITQLSEFAHPRRITSPMGLTCYAMPQAGQVIQARQGRNVLLRRAFLACLARHAVYNPTSVLISARNVSRCSAAQASSLGNR